MLRKLIVPFIVIFGLTNMAKAAEPDPSIFFGHWQGTGYAENADSIYFATTSRDLDVEIAATGDGGFSIRTTTVTHDSGNPQDPKVKTKQSLIIFNKTNNAAVFRATPDGDPMLGNPMWWSRIKGSTLHTYMVQIDADGRWQVQDYARTLSGQGMSLEFTRQRDGQAVRQVNGKLIRIN